MPNRLKRIVVLTATLAVTACAANDPYLRTKTGAAIGAATGAVLGNKINKGKGAYIGAAVGALAGGAVGNYMDRQQQAFDQALAEEQRRHALEIQRLQDGSIKLDIPSEVSFDFDSSAIKPAFVPTLEKIANILNQYQSTVVHIIGYTDSLGPESYNLKLSQRRADSTAAFLASRGVLRDRLLTEGRGEAQPRASNTTEAGRQLNRRVEIIITPVVEGQQQGVSAPPQGGGYAMPPTGSSGGGGY